MSTNRQQQRGPAWLEGYVGADEKITAFRQAHPKARVLTQIVPEREPLTFRAEIYFEDNATTIPNATGHASVDGGSGNRGQSPVEKTETAAISRALWVLGFGGEGERDETRQAAHPNLNAGILQALGALGKDAPWLNSKVRAKYGLADGAAWTQLADAHKDEVLAWLNQMVDKRVEEAKA